MMPLSVALPVVTVSVPVSEPAAISPTRPVTTSAAEPDSVSAVFCASAVAVTVTVSVLKLSVIEVAAEPVVIAIVLSVASPVVTVSAPVSELGRDIADQPAHDLRRRSCQRQHRVVGQGRRIDRHRVARATRGDRGGRRAGGDRYAVVGGIAGGHGERPGQRPGRDIPDQAGHHLGRRA